MAIAEMPYDMLIVDAFKQKHSVEQLVLGQGLPDLDVLLDCGVEFLLGVFDRPHLFVVSLEPQPQVLTEDGREVIRGKEPMAELGRCGPGGAVLIPPGRVEVHPYGKPSGTTAGNAPGPTRGKAV